MMLFLHDNSVAIQALGSLIVAAFTVILVIVTWRYTSLTGRLAKISAYQFLELVRPRLKLSYDINNTASGLAIKVKTTNVGQTAFSLHMGNLEWNIFGKNQVFARISDNHRLFRNILYPNDFVETIYEIPHEVVNALQIQNYGKNIICRIDCVDLSKAGMHSFSYSVEGGLRYSTGSKCVPVTSASRPFVYIRNIARDGNSGADITAINYSNLLDLETNALIAGSY